MEREKNDILYLVVPCYNEQEVLPETSKRLKEKMESLMERNLISRDSRIMFVNDGSKDRTWSMIEELHEQDEIFAGVKLSRNRGHQNALLGGLMTAKEYADMTISMDADLQDDIDVIDLRDCLRCAFCQNHRYLFQTVHGREFLSSDQLDGRGHCVQPCRLSSYEQTGARRAGKL